tara:strand:+ start:1559 stop:2098 length:540 start_codon:yes stop_codon:yes gene_type:complete
MSTIKVNSIIPVAGVPTGGGGGIIQTVQTVKTSQFAYIGVDTWVAITGLTANITPTSTSSKIMIDVMIGTQSAWQDNYGIYYRLYRGGSNLTTAIGDADGSKTRCLASSRNYNNSNYQSVIMKFLDSPSSTSQQTYAIYGLLEDGGDRLVVNSSGGYLTTNDDDVPAAISTITLTEVSA